MKAHLVVSQEPLIEGEGEDQVARCGVIVPKAHFEFWFDSGSPAAAEIMLSLSSISTCSKCLQIGADNKGKYWYGAVPGQEARDFEAA